MLLKEIRVVFLANETFTNLDKTYPKRLPCVLLRPSTDGLKKIPANHHEAEKISSRLHRLPDALEKMVEWKRPPATTSEHEDDLLTRLIDPSVQENLLKRLKRV